MAEYTRTVEPVGPPIEADPVSKVVYVGPSISWRGIFAGSFVGVLVYFVLGTLGIALGGIGLEQVIQHGGGVTGLSVGAGIWMVLSAVIAVFVGGYVATRASGVIPTRIGGIEGLVVASLFFMLAFTGIGMGLGALGSGAKSVVSGAASGVGSAAQNPQVQSVVGQALQGLNLRSSPGEVAQGVLTRLVTGDTDGAANYLSAQAGITRSEADQRLSQVKSQVVGTAKEVGTTAARATQIAGWVFFASVLLGGLAGLFGGVLGAQRNIKRPLSNRDRRLAMEARPEWYGYTYPAHTTEPAPQT